MAEWIVSSCLVIAAVLAVRSGLGRRISAKLRYGLWALVLMRLLVPVQLFTSPVAGLTISYSVPEVLREESVYVLPVQSAPASDMADTAVGEDGAVFDANSFGYARLEDGGATLRRYALRVSPLELLGWLWMAGALALGAVLLAANLRFAARLRRVRRPMEGAGGPLPVYVAEGLPSPCLFGLLRPAVYLTPQAAGDPAMLRHVKIHELTHYRHLDHLWSVLRGAALAIHWWNPLVWLAAFLSRRDGELACDEGALRQLGDGERRAYGETLLALVTAKAGPRDLLSCATTMTGGKRSLRERVRRIACQQKTLVSAAIAVIFLLSLTAVCAFGRMTGDTPPASEMEPDFSALPYTPDLNRDGVQEQILRKGLGEGDLPGAFRLEVVQGDDQLWSDTLDETHGSTYFLYREDGLDYLLEYLPEMQQGACTYAYRLFHLENGAEVTDRENSVAFDLNFDSQYHRFDPAAIAAFMEEVNGLIGRSELLVNTNRWLVHLEEREDGSLYDDILSVLHHPGEDLHGLPLLEALETYARQSEDHPDDTNSPLGNLLSELEAEDIAAIEDDVEAGELVRLLREAASNRLSRFHEYAWFGEEEAWTWSAAELTAAIQSGGTLYLLACDSGRVELAYETAEGCTTAFYESAELHSLILQRGRAYFREELPYAADLDHDGEPDRLILRSSTQDANAFLLGCIHGEHTWSGYANTSHAGWNALFLCRLDGQDYLLQYNPYMGSGMCSYQYKLFYLEEGGEVVVQERDILFDLMFVRDFSDIHSFEPREIADFMEEINGLLEHSIQLLNTDDILLGTFEKEGRLYDSLWFLDDDGFQRDKSKSLLENLILYQNHCLTLAAVPTAAEIFSEIREEDLLMVASPASHVYQTELAVALNAIADWTSAWNVEGWEAQRWAVEVLYTRAGDTGEQSMTLEWGTAGREELVRVTLSGQATALQYSENPSVDGTYLHDVPYSFCVYVKDEAFCDLVETLSAKKHN